MYIYALEEHLELPKELIYAAALLHDIGRAQQYQYNIPHDIAGVEIAREILTDLHFTEQEMFRGMTAEDPFTFKFLYFFIMFLINRVPPDPIDTIHI